MSLRPIIFWSHLAAGVSAGVVVLIMSLTGALLMYEKQIVAWSERGYRSTPPAPGAARLPVDALAARVATSHPDVAPTSIAISADADAPVTIAAGRRTLFVDAYSGAVIGEPARGGVRQALSTVREWHRWLAVSGENRAVARAITGWSNAVFLFIVASGFYIWLPRRWTGASLRAVAIVNPRLSGKARDFNWHNAIGIWSCVPLFFVVLTAMPISFPWASALIFRAVGEVPPPPGAQATAALAARGTPVPNAGGRSGERRPAEGRRDDRAAQPRSRESSGTQEPSNVVSLDGMDALLARAARQEPGWRTITLRVPATPDAAVSFAIDRGNGGQPHLRSTLTLDRRTGDVVQRETFASQSLGRRLRSLSRFTHTGEVLGLAGQTIAGLASAGAVVLVCTGLALAWRRFRAWTRRHTQKPAMTAEEVPRTTAA